MEKYISIIVPIYNAENYLYRCLSSLVAQTYGFIEIICINDGSTDHSGEILNRFALMDPRIKVINQENCGPASARNKGLDAATGKYIMFCDADDSYEPDMCEKMYNAMTIHNVDLVMCDCNINAYVFANVRSENDIMYHKLKLSGYCYIDEKIYNSINIVLWNKILKRSLIKKYDIRFPDGFEHDDACFMSKYLAVSTLYYGLDESLYNYNICNPESLMAKVYKRNNYGKKLDFLYAYYDVMLFVLRNNVRSDILEGFKHLYINQMLYFGQFLNRREQEVMLAVMHEQLKDIEIFEDNKFIKAVRESDLKTAKLYINKKNNTTLLQKVFSLRNKSDRIKVLTVLGVSVSFPRRPKLLNQSLLTRRDTRRIADEKYNQVIKC